tara:strand:- start:52 stop:537 length:486 start_codon:yes stop_codon:yes gene_type:complete
MTFKLHPGAEDYFKDLKVKESQRVNSARSISTLWDMYYLALVIGMKNNDSSVEPSVQKEIKERAEFHKAYTKEYQHLKYIIIALLIKVESKKLGVNLDEREQIKSLIEKYTTNEYPFLSSIASQSLNEYHYAGFEYLKNHIDKPYDESIFWQNYINLIEKL